MGSDPYPLAEPPDTAMIARVNSALLGGIDHYADDRAVAERVRALSPGVRDQLRAARRFHSAAALWACTEGGARGIVTMAAGFPACPDPHEAALAAAEDARACYVDPAESVTLVNRAKLGSDRVSAVQGIVRDPAAMLATAEVTDLPRPLCVILRMVLQYWPPDATAAILALYGTLLPAGSYLAASVVIPSAETTAALTGMLAGAQVRVYRHDPADLADWLDKAGMDVITPGVRDVPSGPRSLESARGRIVGVVARAR